MFLLITSKMRVLFLCLCMTALLDGATINVAGCSQSAVVSAIGSASNGDTIVVNSGGGTCSATWNFDLGSHGITLQANGTVDITIAVTGGLSFTAVNTYGFRITGFNFTGPQMNVSAAAGKAPWRIDHNNFSNSSSSTFIQVAGGFGTGLIDHNTFSAPLNSEMIHVPSVPSGDESGWTNDVTPGSPYMVYIEDNTFTNSDISSGSFNACSAIQSYYGARTVVRYNTINDCQIDQHGTPGQVGARWWEFYENTFVIHNINQSNAMQIRAGSGVIFNNHFSGHDTVIPWIELVEEDSGYPAAYQIGRGRGSTVANPGGACGANGSAPEGASCSPAYVWNNDPAMPVGSGSSNVVAGRDFILSLSPPTVLLRQQLSTDTASSSFSYIPFTHPYPINAQGLPAPTNTIAPPASLSATVH